MKKLILFFLTTLIFVAFVSVVSAEYVNGYIRSNGKYVNGYYRNVDE